ncbi:MAG: four helix bundle protein [Planctomycetia bacterium 21-64-5]|nr:MAG: four helix bundle protein [Planctomycetia bacterium 21-64-5]
MKDFKELQVWQKSHALVLKVYRASRSFPSDERFGLTSQVRKAAAAIPTNIAEGCGRSTDADLARFADIASGSASETEYELLLARDLEYIDRKTHAELTKDIVEVRRMLMGFVRYLRRGPITKPTKTRKGPDQT